MSRWRDVPPIIGSRALQLAVALDSYIRTGDPYWRDEGIHFAQALTEALERYAIRRERYGNET